MKTAVQFVVLCVFLVACVTAASFKKASNIEPKKYTTPKKMIEKFVQLQPPRESTTQKSYLDSMHFRQSSTASSRAVGQPPLVTAPGLFDLNHVRPHMELHQQSLFMTA